MFETTRSNRGYSLEEKERLNKYSTAVKLMEVEGKGIPYVGARMGITVHLNPFTGDIVVPHAGAWMETGKAPFMIQVPGDRASRGGRGLKCNGRSLRSKVLLMKT